MMPALGAALGDKGVDEVVAYVLSLSGRAAPADKVAAGKDRFVLCAACHGADGRGNQTLGAPNLTDQIWLYGGTAAEIRQTIVNGRHGQMPAWSWLGAGSRAPARRLCLQSLARFRGGGCDPGERGYRCAGCHPMNRLAARIGWVVWPSFLAACVGELLFFAAVDPLLLRDAGPRALAEMGREEGYALGFFLFWGLGALSSLLTLVLRHER